MCRFVNKVCLVTGAASGIGTATALAFAKQGAKLVLADVNEDAGRNLEQQIKSMGNGVFFVYCDISKRGDITNLITKTIEAFGRIDCAVNCAGIAGKHTAPLYEYPEEDWMYMMQVNLFGTYYCLKEEI